MISCEYEHIVYYCMYAYYWLHLYVGCLSYLTYSCLVHNCFITIVYSCLLVTLVIYYLCIWILKITVRLCHEIN